jgi:hypothetical protein
MGLSKKNNERIRNTPNDEENANSAWINAVLKASNFWGLYKK